MRNDHTIVVSFNYFSFDPTTYYSCSYSYSYSTFCCGVAQDQRHNDVCYQRLILICYGNTMSVIIDNNCTLSKVQCT